MDFYEGELNLSKSKEALVTSINSIINMPPTAKVAFYMSEEGKQIIKGLQMEADQYKKINKYGMNWEKEDIYRVMKELQEATYEDRGVMLQLLPGPVLSIISDLTNKPDFEPIKKAIKELGIVIEKGVGRTTPAYHEWKAKVNQTLAARKSQHQDGTRFFVVPHADLKESHKTGLIPKDEYDKARETKGKSHHVFYRRNGGSIRKLSSHGSEASALDRKIMHDRAYSKNSKSKEL